MKQKKAIVFFSAGLGDAVLLIPLVKHLKQQGFLVTGFFNSVNPCEEIFRETNLLDELVVCKGKLQQIIYSFKSLMNYDSAYINYFAANRINFLTAVICSSQVFTNRKINSVLFKLFRFKVKYTEVVKNMHDGQQNLNLLGSNAVISLQDFYINFESKSKQNLNTSFIAIQISANNNKNSYRNWPVNYWISFLKMVLEQYPEKQIVLLGDENEVEIGNKIKIESGSKIESLVGKTTILNVMDIIYQSEIFIGLDSGLMHLAVALKKPTFSIWGPSPTYLYGYEKFSPMHKCVSLYLPCSPCHAWINPNHTRVLSPNLCPDHACLQQLMPQEVFNQFKKYVNLLSTHAH